jgi:hypothetical protein
MPSLSGKPPTPVWHRKPSTVRRRLTSNFTLLGLVNETGAVSGSYLFPDGTLRHYYCGRDGIQSATSSGGADVWRAEPGTRSARDPAWKIVCDPSVASDGHDGYWMALNLQWTSTTP